MHIESFRSRASLAFGILLFLYVTGLSVTISGLQIYLIPVLMLYILAIFGPRNLVRTKKSKQINVILILIFILTQISNVLNGLFSADYIVKMFILTTLPYILFCFDFKESHINKPLIYLLVAITISSVIALFQSIGSQWAINIWIVRFMNDGERDAYLLNSLIGGRCCGLASYSLNFGFQLVQVIPIATYFSLTSKKGIRQYLMTVILIILLWGTVCSGSRAATILGLIEFFLVFINIKGIRLAIPYLLLVSLFFLLYFKNNESQAISRLIGRFESEEEGIRALTFHYYFDKWQDSDLLHILLGFGNKSMNTFRGVNTLGSAHNSFLTVLFEFGIIGIILTTSLYWRIFSGLWRNRCSPLAFALFIGLASYLSMSLTNDSALLSADLFHILFVSTIILYTNILDISKKTYVSNT